jgi:hypothetical protein
MKRLIYSSIAAENTTFETVLEILNQAKSRNQEHNISGMLVFDGNIFLQCIEGEETDIDQLYTNLENDLRHHSLHFYGFRIVQERIFSEWTMGYVNHRDEIIKVYERLTGNRSLDLESLDYRRAKLLLRDLSKRI